MTKSIKNNIVFFLQCIPMVHKIWWTYLQNVWWRDEPNVRDMKKEEKQECILSAGPIYPTPTNLPPHTTPTHTPKHLPPPPTMVGIAQLEVWRRKWKWKSQSEDPQFHLRGLWVKKSIKSKKLHNKHEENSPSPNFFLVYLKNKIFQYFKLKSPQKHIYLYYQKL